jgi:hypothetical protein
MHPPPSLSPRCFYHLPSLLPGARKGHKGPRSGNVVKVKKATAVKQSTQRRELLFTSFAPDGTKVTHCLPTERSKDNRTAEEKARLLQWVSVPFPLVVHFFFSFFD